MNKRLQLALLSGGFALAGVALSQALAFLQKNAARKHEKNILLHQKYEEMGEHFIASMQRVRDWMHAGNLEDMHALSHNESADRCHLLCQLYFPDLTNHSATYHDASMGIYYALIDSYNPLDQRPFGAQAVANPAYEEAEAKLFQARDAFIRAIQANSAI